MNSAKREKHENLGKRHSNILKFLCPFSLRMTDYAEEQKHEIEALEAIYPEEFEVVETEPYIFRVNIKSQGEDDEEAASCVLQFTYVEKYPDEALLFEIEDPENLDDEQIDGLTELINEQIEENLGMVMVFTIVSAVQEQLTQTVEDTKQRQIEEKERLIREKEEAEQKKFEGTCVTIETFLAWKKKFDAEMLEQKRIRKEIDKEEKGKTGKELFMEDASLNDSDVKFLMSEDNTVEVDESLFQDLDDLDLDNEEFEEEAAVD